MLIPTAFNHIGNFWTAFHKVALPLYEKIPGAKNRITTKCASPNTTTY